MAATLVLAGLLVALVLDSATADGPVKTSLEVDTLGCGDLEPLWLQAQAVPSASVVPCVATLPVGWSLGDVAVNDGRSVIALHHDRAGGDAMVARLTAACDTGERPRRPPGGKGSGATSWSSARRRRSPWSATTSSRAAA
jgi:hypothetical protein